MSDLQRFTDRVRDEIVTRHGMTEVGDPYEVLNLTETGERVGEVRVWTGPAVPKLVDSRLVVPSLGMDSVMLHAFADSATAAPHLTSDIAGFGDRWNVAIDLTPRVDLAVEPAYLDGVYAPLTDARAAAFGLDGMVAMDIPLRLLAFSSPWITGVVIDAKQLPDVDALFTAYLERFHALVENPIAPGGEVDLVARDAAHRRAQFDPASDEVWDFLAGLLGQGSIDVLLDLVREPGPPAPR